MKRYLFCLTCICAVFIPRLSLADIIFTCPTIADVYIDEMSPDENFNYRTRILIATDPSKGIARGLFAFDIPDDISSNEILGATLYLSGSIHTGGGFAFDIECYALNTPFDEDLDTWNSVSGGDYDDSVFSPGSLPAGNDWETSVDVTALVTGNLDRVRDNGLLIRLQNEDGLDTYQNIASRESTNPEDFALYLEIACEEASTSSSSSSTTTGPVSSTSTIISTTSSNPTSSTSTTAPSTTTTAPPTTSSSSSTSIKVCLIEHLFGTASEEVALLRLIRNEVLCRTPEGRELISLYNEWNPVILQLVEADEELNGILKETLDDLMLIIHTPRD